MYALTVSGGDTISNCSHPSYLGTSLGLPRSMKICQTASGNVEIQPIEVGGLGYGLGRGLRTGFDRLYPLVANVFQSVITHLPKLSLFDIWGVSAADVHDSTSLFLTSKRKEIDQKQKRQPKQGCQKSTMGNCSLPFFGGVKTFGEEFACVNTIGSSGIQIVATKDPWDPRVIGFYNDTKWDVPKWSAQDLVISNDNALVAFGLGGLQVLSLKNPSFPQIIGFFNGTKDYASRIAVLGNRTYVSYQKEWLGSGHALRVFDIQDPSHPKQIGSYTAPNWHEEWDSIALSKNYIFLTGGVGRFIVLDISKPDPIPVVSVRTSGVVFDSIAVQGNFAYLTSFYRNGIFQIVDVTDAKDPKFKGHLERTSYSVSNPVVLGQYAYCLLTRNPDYKFSFLSIVDIIDPMNPIEIDEYRVTTTTIQKFTVLGDYVYFTATVGGNSKDIFQIAKIICP